MRDSEKTKKQLIDEIEKLREQSKTKQDNGLSKFHIPELFKSILTSSKQGLIILQDNAVTYTCGIVDKLFGINSDDLIGYHVDTLIEHITPEFKDYIRDTYYKNKTKPKFTFNSDIQIFDTNGVSKWLEVSSKAMVFDGRHSILAIVRDITGRKKTEIALQDNRQRLELALESAGLAFWDQNFETGEVIRSDRWAEMLGYSPEEIGNYIDDWKKMIHPDDYPEVIQKARKHESGEIPEFDVEHRMKTKSGDWKWIRNWGKIVEYDDSGKPLRAVGTHLDISSRKETEGALKQSEEKYRLLFDAAHEAIFLLSNGRIIDCNKKTLSMFNCSKDQIIGLAPNELSPETQPDGSNSKQTGIEKIKLALDGEPQFFEWLHKKFDGELFEAEVSLNRIDYISRNYVMSIIRDITERKHAEKGLKTSYEILSLANKHLKMESLLEEVVKSVKKLTGCEAVGIRLIDENGRIPYQAYQGFPAEFYEHESTLSIYDDGCMCIDIIKDNYDSSKPYFTEDGSFYINSTLRYFENANLDEKSNTRNLCNEWGYKTVALVPIRIERRVIGLIHCADTEENKMPPEMVKILEQLSIQLGAIVERVKAGEALRDSEERFRNLVESMNDGLLVVDNQLRFTYINEKMADFLKVDSGEIVGDGLLNYLDAKNKKIIKNQWEKRKRGGSESYELTWTARDNTNVVTIISPRTVWGPNKEFKGSFSVVTDITERKQDELIDRAKSRLADKLRGSEQTVDCLKAGCQALAEAELINHSAFVLLDDKDQLTHIDYKKKSGKELMVIKDELPEIIQNFDNYPGMSKSFIIPQNQLIASEKIITPITDQIVNHKGWLISDTHFPGKKIELKTVTFIEDVVEFISKKINEILFLSHLEQERQNLEKKNIALREVLATIEEEKMGIRQRVAQRIDQMVIPTFNRVINNDGTVNRTYYELLGTTIRELVASSGGLMHLYSRLSPREVEICNLIKGGASSKEIAETLHLSVATIQKHRERIRHKLDLANKNINLASFLKNPEI